MAAEQARANGGRWVTGKILGESRGGFEFKGFNQHVIAGRNGEGMQARYVVLDYSGIGNALYSTHALEATHTYGMVGSLKYLGRSIHFAGSTPYTDSGCWFSPYFACSGGKCTVVLSQDVNISWCVAKLFSAFILCLFLLFPKAWTKSLCSLFSLRSFHSSELELTSVIISSMCSRRSNNLIQCNLV